MHFNLLEASDIASLVDQREGETKLGERIKVASLDIEESLQNFEGMFVVLGISEDIGPRANCGRGGADSAWTPFLSKFLNIQSNNFLSGKEVMVLGHFDFSSLADSNEVKALRKATEIIDDQVSDLIQLIVSNGKIPLVIGGGHNNAYGLLKGTSEALNQKINCINCDPHADFRSLEGRHSGNGFSYAKANGFLDQYAILGLHENYNSQSMLQELKQQGAHLYFYEDIFLRKATTYEAAINELLQKVNTKSYGVELDCDSILDMPSSAQSPEGVTAREARLYVHLCGSHQAASYLHLPEAAPSLLKGSEGQVGKLLAYLVSDFIKARKNQQ